LVELFESNETKLVLKFLQMVYKQKKSILRTKKVKL
jgi:hypothetical protein